MLIAVLAKLSSANGNDTASVAAVIFVIVYIATYSGFAWAATPYPTEISELNPRSQATALAASANWLWNFVVVKITPIGVENLGWKFFLVWMCFNGAFVPIIYFLYPETAGKTLEELDSLFYETTHAWEITEKSSRIGMEGEALGPGPVTDEEDVK